MTIVDQMLLKHCPMFAKFRPTTCSLLFCFFFYLMFHRIWLTFRIFIFSIVIFNSYPLIPYIFLESNLL